jgi:hypothetical protein
MLAMADDLPKPRWYRLTPDRFVIGLLVVECLLGLSEQFHWFPFNQHKGWTVLIAVAVIGATILLMLLWFIASLLLRWRFQFSIRSLLVLTVAVALPCSWLAVEIKKARREQEAAAALTKLGGTLLYDFQKAKGQPWNVFDFSVLPVFLIRTIEKTVLCDGYEGKEYHDVGV